MILNIDSTTYYLRKQAPLYLILSYFICKMGYHQSTYHKRNDSESPLWHGKCHTHMDYLSFIAVTFFPLPLSLLSITHRAFHS